MRGRPAFAPLAALAALAFLAPVSFAQEPDPKVLGYKKPVDFVWVESKEFPGVFTAILHGDPSKPGPYVVRNRFSPNSWSRPHYHNSDRLVVVVEGTWWVGSSDKFDTLFTVAMEPGTFVVHHAGQIHYDGAKANPCEVVIYGTGPVTTTILDKQPKKN